MGYNMIMVARSELDIAQAMYSDIYKDVNGFRPRNVGEENWNDLEWLNLEIDSLGVELGINEAHNAEVQARNVCSTETRIEEIISTGAGDRETAIRWMMDAEDCGEDESYLEYILNIPYGYFAGNK